MIWVRAGIGSANLGSAMQKSVRLVEIHSLLYIAGNNRIVLADLGNAIHLNGEKNRDTFSFQFSRERDRFRSSPAVPKDDDAGSPLFVRRQCSVVVQVEAPQHFPVSLLPVTILKSLYIYARGVLLTKILSNLDRAVN